MSDLHSQTLAPTASLVVTVATHVDTEQRCGGWSLHVLETNSVALQCWRVPVTGQANPRVGLLGLPRLAGGIPPAAGRHWGRRCCNLRKALQPDLLCRVMCNRGYIFTLFTKNQFTPTQVPLQVDSATTPDLIHFFFFFFFFFFFWGPEAPLSSNKIYTITIPDVLKYNARFLQIIN